MSKVYRRGAVGALMDEYERAAEELRAVIAGLSDNDFVQVRDLETQDPDCRSIQTIMNHVVRAGYGYADYIRKAFAVASERPEVTLASRSGSLEQFAEMLAYTEATLAGRWEMPDDEMMAVRIESRWGPVFDLEQLLEHAIVHVLRHRRQIERFLARAS